MIGEYLEAGLRSARYETINDDEPYYAEIEACPGVWATERSLDECRQNLLEALEGWLILSLQRGLPVPEIEGVRIETAEPTAVHG